MSGPASPLESAPLADAVQSVRRRAARFRPVATAMRSLPLLLGGWLAFASEVIGASPSPSRAGSTDTRSGLEGPGFVGNPGLAVLVVLLIALGAIATTTLYVRLTHGRQTGLREQVAEEREPPRS